MIKKKLFVIFGWEYRWERELLVALEVHFHVQTLYFQPQLKNVAYKKLLVQINKKIRHDNIDVVLFNIDFLNNIDYLLINAINAPFKGAFTLDNSTLHLRNSLTCLLGKLNIVITPDPLSTLKYRALGLESVFVFLEGSEKYTPGCALDQRPIDVLFIGETKKVDRAAMIDVIRVAGVEVRVEGGSRSMLSYDEMVKLYQSAKIVLNFSKSDTTKNASLEMDLYNYVLELKGRVLEAGLCGALCVTEYTPHIELLFPAGELPTFSNAEQCASIVVDLLSDPAKLEKRKQAFFRRCEELSSKKLAATWEFNFCESPNSVKRIPDWYLVPSFFDRFRWALIYRRPADVLAYLEELASLQISPLRKLWLILRVGAKIVVHGVRALAKRIQSRKQRR